MQDDAPRRVPAPNGAVDLFIATHGFCFDGLCSAALMVRLFAHVSGAAARVGYHGATYGPGKNGVPPRRLRGRTNAILDYRFTSTGKLDWYFDHHATAFATPEDRAAYDAHALARTGTARRFFYDGAYTSCTKLVADVGAATFGLDPGPVGEIVRWADRIDSAAFPSARAAVERDEPVLQLMTVIERACDDDFLARMVPRVLGEGLQAIAGSPEVQAAYAPLARGKDAFVQLVRKHAVVRAAVVTVDLSSEAIDVATKFVTYALFPDIPYSVVLTRPAKGTWKISVGHNPWSSRPRQHDISAICRRFGGGGHAAVGAVALAGDVASAQRVADEIARELGA